MSNESTKPRHNGPSQRLGQGDSTSTTGGDLENQVISESQFLNQNENNGKRNLDETIEKKNHNNNNNNNNTSNKRLDVGNNEESHLESTQKKKQDEEEESMMTGSVVATNDQRLQTIQVPHHQLPTDVMDNNNDNSTRDTADASAKDDDNNRSHNNNDNSATSAVTTGAAPDLSQLTMAQMIERLEKLQAVQAQNQAQIEKLEAVQAQIEKLEAVQAKIEKLEAVQAKIEKLEAKNEKLEAKNEKLEAVQAQNQAKIEKLEAVQAQNQAKKEKLEAEVKHYSYSDMVEKFGGIPDMPRVDPSLKPHVRQGSVDFSVDDKFVTDEDLDFEFNPIDKTTGYSLKSLLHFVHLEENPNDKNGPQILSYQNEATVTDYVQGVVVMCMQSLGYFGKGRLYKEMSLFSLLPDLILVIHKKTRGIILIIEVKMPGKEVFTSQGIAKQVSDYLLLQYRLGNTMPFVLLSSYREACLCHLKPGCGQTKDTIEGGGVYDKYRKIVERAAKQLKEGAALGEMMGANDADQKDKPKTHSPTKPAFASKEEIPLSLSGKRPRRKLVEKATVTLLSPEVVYSRPFNLSNMVHGVTLAIACGLASLKDALTNPTEDCYWPNHNSKIDGLHPQVESGKLQWVQVSNMSIDYMKAPLSVLDGQDISSKYILLQEIGRGESKVFLAVDYDGTACALKVYLDVDAENVYSHEDRAEQVENAKNAAREECYRWKTLQSDYTDYVACLELNGQGVLRMPVFLPVPPELRGDYIDSVKEKLQSFSNKGYLYNEVRWQHVGCRKKEDGQLEIALLDLGSLEVSDGPADGHVDSQILQLREHIRTEPPAKPPQGLLALAAQRT